MARAAVQDKSVSITVACQAFQVSETCYWHQPKRKLANEIIVLARLSSIVEPLAADDEIAFFAGRILLNAC